MWEGGGWAGWSGVGGKWDNCNSIINKYIKKKKENINKSQAEMKNTISELKNTVEGIKRRLDAGGEGQIPYDLTFN